MARTNQLREGKPMSREYRRATTYELSTMPLEAAEKRREAARGCGNALEAARYAVANIQHALNARSRGQAVDADNIDPEDVLRIKINAVRTLEVAAGTLQTAKRLLSELCRRMEREREDARPAALKAKKARELRERSTRGPYAPICGIYRTCAG
jgi:hypothetical protein